MAQSGLCQRTVGTAAWVQQRSRKAEAGTRLGWAWQDMPCTRLALQHLTPHQQGPGSPAVPRQGLKSLGGMGQKTAAQLPLLRSQGVWVLVLHHYEHGNSMGQERPDLAIRATRQLWPCRGLGLTCLLSCLLLYPLRGL